MIVEEDRQCSDLELKEVRLLYQQSMGEKPEAHNSQRGKKRSKDFY